MRGIAAFCIILVHSGTVTRNQWHPAAAEFQRMFSNIGVPFFLAAGFYFTAISASRGRIFSFDWIKKRAWHLLVPFMFWSVMYFGARLLKAEFYYKDADRFAFLLSDPVGTFLFQASSLHLYFLPLLFTGMVMSRFLMRGLLAAKWPQLLVLLVLSVAVYLGVSQTGNGYRLGDAHAFGPALSACIGASNAQYWAEFQPLRIFLVLLVHAVRCLPYIVTGVVFVRVMPTLRASRSRICICALVAGIVFVVGRWHMDIAPRVFLGEAELMLAIVVSEFFRGTRWSEKIGYCSFGIYLIHQLVLEIMYFAGRGWLPDAPGLATLFFIASFGLLFSFCIVATVQARGSRFWRTIFGFSD